MTFDVSIEEIADNYLEEVSIGTDDTIEDFINNYFFDILSEAPFGLAIPREELERLINEVAEIIDNR